MKFHATVCCLVAVLSTTAKAQEFVDETFQSLPKEAQSALSSSLDANFRDPEATKFKMLKFHSMEGEKNINNETLHGFYVCGLVNAKNKHGGYEGYKKFTFSSEQKSFSIGGDFCQ
ncbi:hypothetical protein IB024_01305 [Brucella sp. 6810]|uniref:hypothetical protein n=1 Tax=Brucella sp. 6810 TaxID=2769351 RepID=UPI00165A74ED|nr:hypothetical protein [Brucella sp. 6810]QNQ62426.1 hypothetical protein IB024_01305 [Brucella sp. 6810]